MGEKETGSRPYLGCFLFPCNPAGCAAGEEASTARTSFLNFMLEEKYARSGSSPHEDEQQESILVTM
ncbi:hypothetical protein [Paenibacillus farraposensis]|uniref:hypothetical protein n=1 Tax=Paenibacillus farraposensis TaxID=2807095 RepID=UPI00366B5E03